MKTWKILLTASALAAVVAVPLVNAEQPCSRAELADGAILHPAKPNAYLYFGPDPAKLGEWTEWNGRPGLQTVNCVSATGAVRYAMDLHFALVG